MKYFEKTITMYEKKLERVTKVFGDTVLYSNKVYFYEEIHRQRTDNQNLKKMNSILVQKQKNMEAQNQRLKRRAFSENKRSPEKCSNDGDKLTTQVNERRLNLEIEQVKKKKEQKQNKTNITVLAQRDYEQRGGIIHGFDDAPSISDFSDTPENS